MSYFSLFIINGVVLFHPWDRCSDFENYNVPLCARVSPFAHEGLFCDRTINCGLDLLNNIDICINIRNYTNFYCDYCRISKH